MGSSFASCSSYGTSAITQKVMSVSEVSFNGTVGGLGTGAKAVVGVYVGDVLGTPVGASVGVLEGAIVLVGTLVGLCDG